MERENNFSSQLGSAVIDWQIEDWANDLTMLLRNAGKNKELIAVNEQILQIEWGNRKNTSFFMKMQNVISQMLMSIWVT